MPKTPPGRRPDPMAREVDRLLTRLAQIGPQAHGNGAAHATAPVGGKVTPTQFVGIASSDATPTRSRLLALWARVLLGATLGVVMTQWPYPHSCDLPLLGYLGAVTMVILAGSWLAFASWRLRSGPAHILSLILVYWGIVLAAEQALPRIGYAADGASWRCAAPPPRHIKTS